MTPTLYLTEVGLSEIWIVLATAALTTWWLQRFRRAKAFSSVVYTTLAGLPGMALLFGRSVHAVDTFAVSTLILSCLWTVVGPLLLLVGFLSRADLDAPRGTGIVQALHVLMWFWSTAIAWAATS